MKKKLKNFGKKMKKTNNTNIQKKSLEILNFSKDIVAKYGWNESLFNNLKKAKKINSDNLKVLFPNGYIDLLNLALDELNNNLKDECKKYGFEKLPIHKRIRKIILTKINLMNNKKKFYKKTFYYLLLPTKYKLLSKQLYKSADSMWIIAGDKSVDFNFYTKRLILSGVYSSVLIHFFNNNNILETENLLDNYLLKISKIPQIKKNVKHLSKSLPNFLRFFKRFSY